MRLEIVRAIALCVAMSNCLPAPDPGDRDDGGTRTDAGVVLPPDHPLSVALNDCFAMCRRISEDPKDCPGVPSLKDCARGCVFSARDLALHPGVRRLDELREERARAGVRRGPARADLRRLRSSPRHLPQLRREGAVGMRPITVAVAALLVPLFVGCSSEDEAASCGEVSSCPADMVRVSASCGSFCIDGKEVTRGQYSAFLAQAPAVTGQQEGCEWNTSFEPDDAGCAYVPLAPTGDPNLPVTCVDWCDAAAFCTSVGKKLCTGLDHRRRPARWEAACNAVFGHVESSPPGCNFMTGALRPVGTSQGCHGKGPLLDGLFDLIGNVAEWTDDCGSDVGGPYCSAPGASAVEGAPMCGSTLAYEPTYRDAFLGFRCCAP